jgi:glycosyltransferase involved in cell wall biosynthesis
VLTLGMRALVRLAVARSDRVIVDSQSTGDDVVRLLGVSPDEIDVVPLGIGTTATEVAMAEEQLRRDLSLGDRQVVLSVSAKRPHKNLLRLIDAVAALPEGRRPVLVLPGYPTWHEDELRARAAERGVAEDVRFLGWVDASTLEGLYAAASCFVFPSLYEGFGLPVLEAMARRAPVACSNTSSLPEVAGDAALLFDPEDPDAITTAIGRLLDDGALADELRERGRRQVERFSWRRSAEATIASYRRALP